MSLLVAVSALPALLHYSPATPLVYIGLPALAVIMAAALVAAVAYAWRVPTGEADEPSHAASIAAACVLAWAAFCLMLAARGVLGRFESRPPPLFLVMVVGLVGTFLIGRSFIGRKLASALPLWLIVASQCFRLPLELVMHRAAATGTMPVEMSFSGYNFDILTGASAIVIALGLRQGSFGRRVTIAWNIVGLLLLLGINVIALLATPVFQAFGPEHLNLWVADPPFVLLPTFLVPMALLGHVLVAVKLRQLGKARSGPLPVGIST